jgi:hypothetical protein
MPPQARARPAGIEPLVPAIAGIALLAVVFLLPWFGASDALEQSFSEAEQIREQFGGPGVVMPDTDDNAWNALELTRFALLAAGFAAVALTVVRLGGRPAISKLRFAALATALGSLATALVLYHLVNPPQDRSRAVGVFAGLVASAAVALSAWRALREEELVAHPRRSRGAGVSPRDPAPGRVRSATRTRSRSSSD